LSDRNLSDLDAAFRPVAQQILDQANAQLAPSTVRPIVTWRDAADQEAAKCKGASKAGPGQSPHDCVDAQGNPAARAFDFGVFTAGGKYVTNGADSRYAQVGQIAIDLAGGDPSVWGGSWSLETDGVEPDYDHIQMQHWRTA
jgi:hypothetical protein